MAGGTHYTQIGKKTDFFSILHVNYPKDSVCTCSNDTKILSAPDTSGVYIFLLPTEGEWTLFLNGISTDIKVNVSIRGSVTFCDLRGI